MPIRPLIVPALVVCACALAGCGQNAPAQQTAASTPVTASATPLSTGAVETPGDTATSGAATSALTPTTAGTGAPQTSTTAGLQGALPQTDPGDYGDAAIEAAKRGDRDTLLRYVAPSALGGVNPAALPKSDLVRTACEDDMCSWSAEDGKRVTMTFDLDKVKAGEPRAITAVTVG